MGEAEEEAEGSGAMFLDPGGADGRIAPPAVRRDVVRPTDLHVLGGPVVDGVRTGAPSPCPRSCGAIVWLEEGGACCKGGKNILGEAFNPPIDAEYLALLQMPYMSEDSRHLNAMLAMATQGTSPSRKDGGIGLMQQNYGHCCLLGKTYLAMYDPHHTNSALDNFKLPRNLLQSPSGHCHAGHGAPLCTPPPQHARVPPRAPPHGAAAHAH